MAEIYLLTTEEAAKIPGEYCLAHFRKRLARANRFLRREDYLRCIGAGALLHGILGVEEKNLVLSEYGRLSDPTLGSCFSISHSGSCILLAVDRGEIGADIEYIDPRHLDLADRVCLPEEADWLRGRGAAAFFTLWTLKESMMKLTGRGMRLDAQSFSVLPLITRGEMSFEGRKIYASTKTLGEYQLSVCAENPPGEPEIIRVSAEELI